MVRIAMLDGVKIYLYPGEHPPPHVHAVSAEYVALVQIDPPMVLKGSLPLSIERRMILWMEEHREFLLNAWISVGNKRKPETLNE